MIGALIWKPYDRVFGATIRAQQIELVHVRTVAAFRGNTDLEHRIRVCDEALAALRHLDVGEGLRRPRDDAHQRGDDE